MKIIKRDGREAEFDRQKIVNAISKANEELPPADRMSGEDIVYISNYITNCCEEYGRAVGVEEIQDMVEECIVSPPSMALWNANYKLMKKYSDYRIRRSLLRKKNTTDGKILSLLRGGNELAKQENANKNPIVISTMRDYLASEVSEDICRRYVFPEDVVEAHDEGIIHIHDMGYVSGQVTNCELVNLEDMLQNGTIITDTMIETPHSFSTACNIATQIIAQVTSNTYGL